MKKILFVLISLPTLVFADTLKLEWDPVTLNTDGTPVLLGGYKLYQGVSPGVYSKTLYVSASAPRYSVVVTTPGTYYYSVSAYSKGGLESVKSNEISVTVSKPTAPGNLR